jgi:hypothetical protein
MMTCHITVSPERVPSELTDFQHRVELSRRFRRPNVLPLSRVQTHRTRLRRASVRPHVGFCGVRPELGRGYPAFRFGPLREK